MALLTAAARARLPGRPFRRWRIGVALALLAVVGGRAAPQPLIAREYQVKAVFLFNFAHFVEWPPAAFSDPGSPLVIGVLGDDPFDRVLDEAVRGEKVEGHPLVVRRYRRAVDVTDCQILFISRSETSRLEEIFALLRDRNVLTVGDADTFSSRGGMIRFVSENNQTRLRINLEAARAANLRISSKLLRPADIVGPGRP